VPCSLIEGCEEVTYHAIDGPVTSPLTHYNPSFWTIAGGYKKYF
jgi:hypothetical protein